ncbi:hypothetical protein FPV33_21255 [Klebsiella aerogenes]|uniref:Uncharacterized protein n=1 Tax=Klebsiella aerogenes (strain ATCC 13048 / DSM 30053 / CCUG 1429 / JCM 1235 / KCTC 2190 / NBRC 13534 / NCIMB 10102 / NCTC 10006 / CDC 819-56) TaxID=1028307 RepID=A0A0H3FW60_KLEAK|nr:hypothetical protein EAE_10770 [Klebsiella aerogenes KCTC 2190]ATM89773.1 hypothetical protein CRN78_04185 [Klebsiella aerogenes]MDI4516533.1 hypothetical protein [Escherichia coli]ATX86230.1 hypothetical protein AM345_04815 [Klebsiella aerogenes]ATX99602.1 hypothetical protein AM334_01690 [Klebsiella aerogenes]
MMKAQIINHLSNKIILKQITNKDLKMLLIIFNITHYNK